MVLSRRQTDPLGGASICEGTYCHHDWAGGRGAQGPAQKELSS